MQRRTFLKLLSSAGATVAAGGGVISFLLPTGRAQGHNIGGKLTKFVDRLPIPNVIEPNDHFNGKPVYKVTMREFRQKLHRDLPPTTLWGYDGQYPGPTFETRRGHPISVQWLNDLPSRHFLPIDRTIHGDESPTPEVRTVVHLHGAKILPDRDRKSVV